MLGFENFETCIRIPKVTLLVFCVRCGTLNSNQAKECEYVMEFPLIHFNIQSYETFSDTLATFARTYLGAHVHLDTHLWPVVIF